MFAAFFCGYMKIIQNIAVALVIFAIWGGVAFYFGARSVENIETRTDTVVVREVVRDTVLVPVKSYVVRTEIVRDTTHVEVEVPIERKEYKTDDYRAVVEGFRPSLVEMEVYRQTQLVTKTIAPKNKRGAWACKREWASHTKASCRTSGWG